jgi:hypothetical protein
MFERLAHEQLAFAAQDDPTLEAIERWVGSSKNVGREVTTAELFADLRELSGSSQPHMPFDFKSAKAFGVYLAGNKATLRTLFGATDRTAGGRRHLWTFNNAPDRSPPELERAAVKGESKNSDPTLFSQGNENTLEYLILKLKESNP